MLDASIQSIIDAFSENVAITDERGDIVAVNRGWRQFADRNDLNSSTYCVRENYLAVLDDGEIGSQVRRGFLEVLAGQRGVFELEYPCHSHHERRWYLLTITRFLHGAFHFVIAHKDITAVKNQEHALQNVLFQTIDAIGSTIEKKDPYTSGHQRRTALLAARIARELGLAGRAVVGVWFGALIHDVGKIYVPSEILNRPGRLSRVELDLVREHAAVGYDIVHHIAFPWPVAEIVHQHHERLDGSGYPGGLRGDAILLDARIVGVADVFEAMSSHRPYRPALRKDLALAELAEGRGRFYDAAVVDACLAIVGPDDFDLAELAPPVELF
jgi:putative nucleotidyltransferase with HDIG domain